MAGWTSNILLLRDNIKDSFERGLRMCVNALVAKKRLDQFKWNFAPNDLERKISEVFANGLNCLSHFEMAAIWHV